MGLFDFILRPQIKGVIKFLELEDWYNSLSVKQQKILKEYSGKGEDLTKGNIYSSQTQQHFLWVTASNAIYYKDYEFAILLAEKGLTAQGSLVDRHYVYNSIIKAYEKLGDYISAKRYCLAEFEDIPNIGKILKENFDGELPSTIPCRDTLFEIVAYKKKDYDETERLIRLFTNNGLLSREEAKEELQKIKLHKLQDEANNLLKKGVIEKAKSVFIEIIKIDQLQEANIYKRLGNYYLENKMDLEALQYFQKAITIDPLINGVRNKLQRLSKRLGVKLESNKEQTLSILRDKEKKAKEWWEKRDLANEYVKIKKYNNAWKLFNEAILLRSKEGMPCNTIYSNMGKMREKEKNYKDAIFLYMLVYLELLNEPPKYVSKGIDRCLNKLGLNNINHSHLYRSVKKKIKPRKMRELIDKMIEKKLTP